MAKNVNSSTFDGRLTSDADFKATSGEWVIITFSIAVGDWRKGEDGNMGEAVDFIPVKILSKSNFYQDKLFKGAKVTVSGRMRQDRWEDEQKNKRSKIYLMAEICNPDFSNTDNQNSGQNNNSGGGYNNQNNNNNSGGNNSYSSAPSNNNNQNNQNRNGGYNNQRQGNNGSGNNSYQTGNGGGHNQNSKGGQGNNGSGNFEDDIPF